MFRQHIPWMIFQGDEVGQYVYFNLPFLSNRFLHYQKSRGKNLNILRMKRVFNIKWKAFFIISKYLPLKKKKLFFLESESPTLS